MTTGRTPLLAATVALTQQAIDAYARASGDFNPIHVDEQFARTTSFGGTIAHGLLMVGMLSDLMARYFGVRWYQRGVLSIRFKGPARPGDILTFTVFQRDNAAGKRALEYEVHCFNHRNEVIFDGQAKVD